MAEISETKKPKLGEWWASNDHYVSCGHWIEVTEAEALARVKPVPVDALYVAPVVTWGGSVPKPVESPDDWVEITNPNHMPRDGVDWFNGGTGDSWIVHERKHCRTTLAEYMASWSKGKFRCRRKDLPAIAAPVPVVKRVPVKLWVSYRLDFEHGDWPIRCTPANEEFDDGGRSTWLQIKSDKDGGFYVEVQP